MTKGRQILRSRWLLCALRVLGAALFVVGFAAERSSKDDRHAETAGHSEPSESSAIGHDDGEAGEAANTSTHDPDGEEGDGGEPSETGEATVAAASADTESDESVAHDEATEAGDQVNESHEESERVLGVKLESTPLVMIAVLASIALGGATVLKLSRALLIVTAAFSIGFGVFDIAEAAHQFDESKTGIALLAVAIAAIHALAAFVAIQWTTRPVTT